MFKANNDNDFNFDEDDEFYEDEEFYDEESDDEEYDEEDESCLEIQPVNPVEKIGGVLKSIFGDMEHIDVKSSKIRGRIDTEGLTIKSSSIKFETTPEMRRLEKKGQKMLVETEEGEYEEECKRRSIRNCNKKKKKK